MKLVEVTTKGLMILEIDLVSLRVGVVFCPIESRSGYGGYMDFGGETILTLVDFRNLEGVVEPIPILYSLIDKCGN
jgi:hypothetical protein